MFVFVYTEENVSFLKEKKKNYVSDDSGALFCQSFWDILVQ